MVELYPLVLGVLEGVVFAHLGLHAIGAAIGAAIFLFSLGRSPVALGTRLAGLARSIAVLLLTGAAFAALILVVGWAHRTGNPYDLYALVVAAAAMSVYVLFRILTVIEIARLSAWDPGFAEQLHLTPWRKRALLLQTWTTLHNG